MVFQTAHTADHSGGQELDFISDHQLTICQGPGHDSSEALHAEDAIKRQARPEQVRPIRQRIQQSCCAAQKLGQPGAREGRDADDRCILECCRADRGPHIGLHGAQPIRVAHPIGLGQDQ